jgi:hypothetical protein
VCLGLGGLYCFLRGRVGVYFPGLIGDTLFENFLNFIFMEGIVIRINQTEAVRLKIYTDPTVDKQRINREKLFENIKTLLPLKLLQSPKDRSRADLFRCCMTLPS